MIIMIGDLIAVEHTPSGAVVDFRRERGQGTVEEFIPDLKPLAGSCVVAIGEGAKSNLPAKRIRFARRRMKQVLTSAGIGFVATSSTQIPPGCPPR